MRVLLDTHTFLWLVLGCRMDHLTNDGKGSF
jgi:PIN domain nuclease of toxin-antitoxin system